MTIEKCRYRTKEIAFSVVQTEVESVRKKDVVETGFRVYEDGMIGVAGALGECGHLGVCDQKQEGKLVDKAREKLNMGIEYPYPPSAQQSITMDMTCEIIPLPGLFPEILELLSQLRQQQPGFSFAYRISQTWVERDLVNDRGLNLHYRDHYMMVGLTYKEKTSASIIDGCIGYAARRYDRDEFLSMADHICTAFRQRLQPLPEGRYPVIFPEDFSLISNKFASDLFGRTFATGGSLFSGKRGEKLFSDHFTLYQCQDPRQRIGPFFDAEGVVNENYRYTLVDEGTLLCPYTDKRTAVTYGLPLTGSAGADYDEVPSLSCYPLKIGGSGNTLKELLGGQKGIYIHVADGGDYTPDGQFATPVQVAFLFDGERLLGRLPECQISGNLFDMFGAGFRGKSSDMLFPLTDNHELVIELELSRM